VKSDTNPEGPYWTSVSQTISPEGTTPIIAYRCESGSGLVGFSTTGIGKIHQLSMDQNKRVIVKRDSIIAASEGVQCDRLHLPGEDDGNVSPHLFVTLSGSGNVYLHGSGNLVDFSLSPKENLVVDGKNLLMMDSSVDHTPKPVGKPGQDSPYPYILLMQLTGPGQVILDTQS
jgi:uncharacterized protein (AIM24 family)